MGEQANFRGRRLLQFAVGPAVYVVLPHRQVALLRQRMRDRARIRAAERLELVGGESDDDFVLDGDDLKQIGPGFLGPRGWRATEDENRQSAALQLIAQRKHALAP